MDADTSIAALKQITDLYTAADDTIRNAAAAAIQDNLDFKNTLKAMGVELPESYWEGMNEGIEANYQSTVTELYQKTNSIAELLRSRTKQLEYEGIQAGQEKIYNFSNPVEFAGTALNLSGAFWKGVRNLTSQEQEINKQIREQTGFDKILEEQNKLQAELESRMPNYKTNVSSESGGGFRPSSPGGGFRPARSDSGAGGGFRPEINSLKNLQSETVTVTKEYGAATAVEFGNGAIEKQDELKRMISDTVGGAAEGAMTTVLPVAKSIGGFFGNSIAEGYESFRLPQTYQGPVQGILSKGSTVDWYGSGNSGNSGEMEATITIYNQIDMDGDTVAEKVNDINARLLYRNNGR